MLMKSIIQPSVACRGHLALKLGYTCDWRVFNWEGRGFPSNHSFSPHPTRGKLYTLGILNGNIDKYE
jgi:hypothetical protein